MNERIEKLAEQAGMEPEDGAIWWVGDGDLEKFAELIVRNCVEIVETQRVPIYSSRSGEIAARWAMDALRECRDEIKKHFGVK